MKCKWQECTIGDLGQIVTGKTPPTKNNEYWGGKVMFITPKDIQATKHIFKTERYVTSEGKVAVRGAILPKGSICVSCIGNIGYLGITTEECISNQQINSIIVNENNDIDFVYYLLKSLWAYFKNYEGQSTALSILNKTQFSKIKVQIPNIEVQKKIAGVLKMLDEKIEQNNAVNNNLEQQAQAIYKAWFVDFVPFNGIKPTSWVNTDIYSIANIIYGAPFASKLFNTDGIGKPIIRIRDLKEQDFVTFTTEEHPKGHLIHPGDIVVGMDGEFRPYIWGNEKAWLNQRVCIFENKRPKGKAFLFYTIKPLLNIIEQTQVATTVIHIGKKDFDAFEVLLPSEDVLNQFDEITTPMVEEIVNNRLENKRLSNLRDALLPMLMSGELDVSDIDL